MGRMLFEEIFGAAILNDPLRKDLESDRVFDSLGIISRKLGCRFDQSWRGFGTTRGSFESSGLKILDVPL